jgi:hypothetical protein
MADTIEERLANAEKRIAELKKPTKDFWDVFQIVASLLIPASIAFVGYHYSETQKQAELQNNRITSDQQIATSHMQVRVGQAQLIATFMESLLSEKPQRQRLAIAAVLVALPDDGPQLVKIVSQDTSRPESQTMALTLLDQRRSSLIRDCFNNDKPTRIRATTELSRGWQADDKLIGELLRAARAQADNAPGIINSLTILENVNGELITAHQEEITSFLNSLRSPGSETQGHISQVRSRLASKSTSQ